MLEIQAHQHIVLCKLSLIPSSCCQFGRCANFQQPADGQALAEGLKSNGSLGWLELRNNNIGDRGAEAPAAECLLVLGDLSDSLGRGWRCGKKGQVIR